jgi:hypothetical protein
MDIDAIFSGMAGADIGGGGNYFTKGLHDVSITEIRAKDGYHGLSFIAGFKVDNSTSEKHPADSTASWVVKLDNPKTKVRNFGEIKALVLAALGIDPVSIKPADVQAHEQATLLARAACGSKAALEELKAKSIDGDKFLIGRKLRIECTEVPGKVTERNPSGIFTRHTFHPAPKAA